MAGYRLMMRHNERVITINATLQFLAFFLSQIMNSNIDLLYFDKMYFAPRNNRGGELVL